MCLLLLFVLAVLPGSGIGASHGRAAPPPVSASSSRGESTLRFDDVLDVWSEQSSDVRTSGDLPPGGGSVPSIAGRPVTLDCRHPHVLCPSEVFDVNAHGALSAASQAKLSAALGAELIGADGDTFCARRTRVHVRADGTPSQRATLHGYVSVTLPTRCVSPGVPDPFETTLTANFTLTR